MFLFSVCLLKLILQLSTWGYFKREGHKSADVFVEPPEQREHKEFLLQALPWKSLKSWSIALSKERLNSL